ncbi:inverse autotransporter beta domain-containing protein [Synechococcus sp. A15-60]|uniref:inverse autotransporter beta domain-containing protein n=1 Tax=Synechococcus sp. A15-60 TaxID=1050655 RepID=UPI0018626462|nr:inverse autotransporter beta domain-containing protein [Synechococcus sp. A15-60]QNI47612.1 putative carbamoyl-phosphate synthase L chain [Synechococcus sp. A15-60]
MQRSINLSLSLGGAAALVLSSVTLLPAAAQDADSAEDLGGVMSISLKDVVKPNVGFQGALQGAGTPNQAGIGGFLPLSVGENSVWFLDALVNVNFADRDGESSIINTDVDGGFSTSTRLGYRWLNGDRSWMYGLNAGYDTRTIKSGDADTNIPVFDKQTIFFNQVAVNAEAVSNSWTFNGYGLIPFGDIEQRLNSVYDAGALNTYGLDVGYFITPQLHASAGYYYQHRDQEDVDGSGVRGRLAYEISQGLTTGINISYDEAFDTRVSADISVRFGGPNTTAAKKKKWENPTIHALTASPKNRDVRVHDMTYCQRRLVYTTTCSNYWLAPSNHKKILEQNQT